LGLAVYAAKTHLSRLLDRAGRGEEVIIYRRMATAGERLGIPKVA
jgi:antitoxin (DNA-binding transcriptional repressor) of toxin-antitoxin stability system